MTMYIKTTVSTGAQLEAPGPLPLWIGRDRIDDMSWRADAHPELNDVGWWPVEDVYPSIDPAREQYGAPTLAVDTQNRKWTNTYAVETRTPTAAEIAATAKRSYRAGVARRSVVLARQGKTAEAFREQARLLEV